MNHELYIFVVLLNNIKFIDLIIYSAKLGPNWTKWKESQFKKPSIQKARIILAIAFREGPQDQI